MVDVEALLRDRWISTGRAIVVLIDHELAPEFGEFSGVAVSMFGEQAQQSTGDPCGSGPKYKQCHDLPGGSGCPPS